MAFKFKKMSDTAVDRKINERNSKYEKLFKSEFTEFKFKEGENRIRVIPDPVALEEDEDYGKPMYVHYGIGADGNQFLSLLDHFKKADPIEEERERLMRQGNEEAAKKLRVKKRIAVWIIDRKEEEKGPQLLNIGLQTHQDMLKNSRGDDGELIHHYDPEEGYDLIVTRTGKDETTKYACRLARKSTPLSDNEKRMNKWLDFVTAHPIKDCLQFHSYDYIASQFGGASKADDPDADADDGPKTRSSARVALDETDDEDPKPKAKPKLEDDDAPPAKPKAKPAADEDEDAPPRKPRKADPDEEEEDPKPKKKPKADEEDAEDERPAKKTSKPVLEDEDEDPAPPKKKKVVEEDDDEEPAPKKKPKPDPDEDEEPAPKKKKVVEEDEDEDPKPRKPKAPVEDDDEPSAKPKKRVVDDGEDERPAKPKKRVVEDDD